MLYKNFVHLDTKDLFAIELVFKIKIDVVWKVFFFSLSVIVDIIFNTL